jgi:chemotaxis methyl-accepting protein methylase
MTYLPEDTAIPLHSPHCGDDGLHGLLEKIHKEGGWDLHNYKKASLRRRIAVRLHSHNISSCKDYHSILESNPSEYPRLLSTVTIKVSEFFRDPEVFDIIGKLICGESGTFSLPGLRVWSCGCARGEEAYSMGILLAGAAGIGNLRDVSIFATDIDPRAIDFARKGCYSEDSMKNVDEAVRNAYFYKDGKGYKVREEIRHLIRFGALDIIKNMPLPKIDILLCRNLLIYFEKESQRKVLEKLDFALKPGGILVLGKAEVLPPSLSSNYREVVKGSRVHRKRS